MINTASEKHAVLGSRRLQIYRSGLVREPHTPSGGVTLPRWHAACVGHARTGLGPVNNFSPPATCLRRALWLGVGLACRRFRRFR